MRVARAAVRLVAVLAVAAMLTSCGLLGSNEDRDRTPDARVEQADLSITLCCGALDPLPIHLAERRGYFAREGLVAHITVVPDGDTAVGRVISGEADIAFASYSPMILAQSKHLGDKKGGLRIVGGGTRLAWHNSLLVVRPGSPIYEPEQLAGKRVAITARNTMTEFLTASTARVHGVDTSTIKWVDMPFPQMADAVASGKVDAALMTEPFLTLGLTAGKIVQLWDAADADSGIPIGGYLATGDLVRTSPRTIAAFQRALAAASDLMNEDWSVRTDLVRAVGNGAIDEDEAKIINWTNYQAGVSPASLEAVVSRMADFGTPKFDKTSVDLASMVVPVVR